MNATNLFTTAGPYGSLPCNARKEIFNTLKRREYQPGDLLISEFSRIEHVGLFVSGKADILMGLHTPLQTVVGSLSPGEFFGDLACLSNGKSLVSIVCREVSVAYLQTHADFWLCLTSHDSLKVDFLNASVGKLRHILHLLLNNNGASFVGEPSEVRIPKGINKALHFINSHYDSPLSVVQVAQMSGMGTSTFSRRFKQYLGVSFKTYLNQLRVAKAKDFLIREGLNVTEACFAAGFNDTAYFSRTFRRIEGISPSQLKQRARKTMPVADGKRQ